MPGSVSKKIEFVEGQHGGMLVIGPGWVVRFKC